MKKPRAADGGGDSIDIPIKDFAQISDPAELRRMVGELGVQIQDLHSQLQTAVAQHTDVANRYVAQAEALEQLRADHLATVTERDELDTRLSIESGKRAEAQKLFEESVQELSQTRLRLQRAEALQSELSLLRGKVDAVINTITYDVALAKQIRPQNETMLAMVTVLEQKLQELIDLQASAPRIIPAGSVTLDDVEALLDRKLEPLRRSDPVQRAITPTPQLARPAQPATSAVWAQLLSLLAVLATLPGRVGKAVVIAKRIGYGFLGFALIIGVYILYRAADVVAQWITTLLY